MYTLFMLRNISKVEAILDVGHIVIKNMGRERRVYNTSLSSYKKKI